MGKYTGYSPLQTVNVTGLKIPNSKFVLLKLRLINGDHNAQLQMDPEGGFAVTVTWSAEVSPDPPTPPSPWLSPPTDGVGVTRGPLVFALHPKEHLKVTRTFTTLPLRPKAVDTEIGTNDTWNYGLLPKQKLEFVATPSAGWGTDFAFNDQGEYPFYITAKARQVQSWGFWKKSLITEVPPPSPVTCASQTECGDETELRLVPFGSTNLRISVFPWIDSVVDQTIF